MTGSLIPVLRLIASISSSISTSISPVRRLVSVGNNDYLKATHIGRITRTLLAPDGTLHSIDIGGCLHVPDMAANLISGEVLRSKGLLYRNDTRTLFLKDGSIIGQVRNMRGLPQLVQSVSASAITLHTKHISLYSFRTLQRTLAWFSPV